MNIDANSNVDTLSREQRARVFAALGDPIRLGIMDLLHLSDRSPDSLASALGIPGNLLAHHLNVLHEVGLISRSPSRHDRRRTYVHLTSQAAQDVHFSPENFVVPRVVFVCTHNSARSILAQSIWRQASAVPSASAGTHPADQINPGAQSAALRHGISIQQATPQLISEVVAPADLVVSVCDSVNEELGDIPNTHLHWSIPDPVATGSDQAFDHAITDLQYRIAHLATQVTASTR